MRSVPALPRTTYMSSPTETSAGSRPQRDGDVPAAWTVEELSSVWGHQQARVNARIEVIERAITALMDSQLAGELRCDAERAAHTLAGSLGTFGFISASEAAGALELELAHPTPDRAPMLSALLLTVQHGVEGPVALCPDVASVVCRSD